MRTCELPPTPTPTEPPKANVRLDMSTPLFRTLCGPDPTLNLAIGHSSAIRLVWSGIWYPPPTPKSNDDPLRPSYEVLPTRALPYTLLGTPYPNVPSKLFVPSANCPPPATCIRPLENEGMPTQACAAA